MRIQKWEMALLGFIALVAIYGGISWWNLAGRNHASGSSVAVTSCYVMTPPQGTPVTPDKPNSLTFKLPPNTTLVVFTYDSGAKHEVVGFADAPQGGGEVTLNIKVPVSQAELIKHDDLSTEVAWLISFQGVVVITKDQADGHDLSGEIMDSTGRLYACPTATPTK